jgi:hypothetical protein
MLSHWNAGGNPSGEMCDICALTGSLATRRPARTLRPVVITPASARNARRRDLTNSARQHQQCPSANTPAGYSEVAVKSSPLPRVSSAKPSTIESTHGSEVRHIAGDPGVDLQWNRIAR